MKASDRTWDKRVMITGDTTPFNPADFNIKPNTATLKGGHVVEIRATCVGCNQKCYITTDGICLPAQNILNNSWENEKDISPVGAVLKVQCQSILVLQKKSDVKHVA